jgi:RimJ/RimL family protein N-acetyltransferase
MNPASVYLRPLDGDDLDRIHRWQNDATLYANLLGYFRPASRDGVEKWLKAKQESSTERNLAICRSSDQIHIGNIYLREIDWTSRTAELHIFIGESVDRGQGLGRAAVHHMLRNAFGDLDLRRVYLRVLANNSAAIGAYTSCGFTLEGTLRAHVFKDGEYHNVLMMGILAGEWLRR